MSVVPTDEKTAENPSSWAQKQRFTGPKDPVLTFYVQFSATHAPDSANSQQPV
jgi:hypothetical protein